MPLFKKQATGSRRAAGRLILCIIQVWHNCRVHTAPGSGPRCSWHRREKGWRPLCTSPALTKEALKKRPQKKNLQFLPALLLSCFCCSSVPLRDQLILDMPHSEAIFITQILGACALCTVESKSPVLAFILVIFIYDIHLHSNKYFCFSICLISSSASTSLFPSTTFCSIFLFPIVFFSHTHFVLHRWSSSFSECGRASILAQAAAEWMVPEGKPGFLLAGRCGCAAARGRTDAEPLATRPVH